MHGGPTTVTGSSLPRRLWQSSVAFWVALAAGCSTWNEGMELPSELPAVRMSTDSVALEITFVRVAAGQEQVMRQVWSEIDEQILEPETRGHLNENGFRAGLVGLKLTPQLRDLLAAPPAQTDLEGPQVPDVDVLSQIRRIQSRAGKRAEIVTSGVQDQLVVLHRNGQTSTVGGKTFQDAQCVLAVRSYPQGDGSVRLEMIPEVHYGQPRKQWVAGEGTFHLVVGRDREIYSDLTIDVTLTNGQTLVLSTLAGGSGLGRCCFVNSGNGDSQQKILLIRLAQTQRDSLFDQEHEEFPLEADPAELSLSK